MLARLVLYHYSLARRQFFKGIQFLSIILLPQDNGIMVFSLCISSLFFFLFFFFALLGFGLRTLAKQVLYHLNHCQPFSFLN
jgi:hypothetical protein